MNVIDGKDSMINLFLKITKLELDSIKKVGIITPAGIFEGTPNNKIIEYLDGIIQNSKTMAQAEDFEVDYSGVILLDNATLKSASNPDAIINLKMVMLLTNQIIGMYLVP